MVFTTVSREKEANKIANVCVEENLAACVQISKVESFYKWEGSKENCDEYKIIFKTLSDNYFELEKKYCQCIRMTYHQFMRWNYLILINPMLIGL